MTSHEASHAYDPRSEISLAGEALFPSRFPVVWVRRENDSVALLGRYTRRYSDM